MKKHILFSCVTLLAALLTVTFSLQAQAPEKVVIVPIPIQPKPVYTVNTTAHSVDSIEDVNGDGIRDFILGDKSASRAELRSGRNGALLGTMIGPPGTEFGIDVASTGDVDGDGLEDILIGAPGQAFLFSSSTLVAIRNWTSSSPGQGGGLYGQRLARAGQINGTGPEEVLITQPLYAPTTPVGASHRGLVEVIDFAGGGTTVLKTIFGTADYEEFGDSVANTGDLDGDAIDDFVVGATRFFGPTGIVCQPGNQPGIARVYSGASLNFAGAPTLLGSMVGTGPADTFGFSTSGNGDMTNDGINDILVGSVEFCQTATPRVHTYNGNVIAGAGGGIVAPLRTRISPANPCLHYGYAVTNVGNITGAARDEFVATAIDRFSGCGLAGVAYVHNGVNGNIVATLQPSAASTLFGYDASELGRIGNKDYFIITDPGASRVYVYGM